MRSNKIRFFLMLGTVSDSSVRQAADLRWRKGLVVFVAGDVPEEEEEAGGETAKFSCISFNTLHSASNCPLRLSKVLLRASRWAFKARSSLLISSRCLRSSLRVGRAFTSRATPSHASRVSAVALASSTFRFKSWTSRALSARRSLISALLLSKLTRSFRSVSITVTHVCNGPRSRRSISFMAEARFAAREEISPSPLLAGVVVGERTAAIAVPTC